MKLTWYGHAAWLIETSGLRIILDPYRYPDAGGYLPVDDSADVVVLSHENDRYHSHLGQLRPPFEVLRGLEFPPEGRSFGGIDFHAIRVFENAQKLMEDEVTIIHFRAEGLQVVFLGDLGHLLSEEELASIVGADLLLAAAGGPPTIGFDEIPELIAAIRPRVILPMHYKTPKINLPIEPVERFFDCLPSWGVAHRPSSTWEVTKETLPTRPTIVSLEHLR